eukprot:scaffold64749_cov28-Tisochrysis_lutea.AAC.10
MLPRRPRPGDQGVGQGEAEYRYAGLRMAQTHPSAASGPRHRCRAASAFVLGPPSPQHAKKRSVSFRRWCRSQGA